MFDQIISYMNIKKNFFDPDCQEVFHKLLQSFDRSLLLVHDNRIVATSQNTSLPKDKTHLSLDYPESLRNVPLNQVLSTQSFEDIQQAITSRQETSGTHLYNITGYFVPANILILNKTTFVISCLLHTKDMSSLKILPLEAVKHIDKIIFLLQEGSIVAGNNQARKLFKLASRPIPVDKLLQKAYKGIFNNLHDTYFFLQDTPLSFYSATGKTITGKMRIYPYGNNFYLVLMEETCDFLTDPLSHLSQSIIKQKSPKEEKESFLQILFEKIEYAIAIIDTQGNILQANHFLKTLMFDYSNISQDTPVNFSNYLMKKDFLLFQETLKKFFTFRQALTFTLPWKFEHKKGRIKIKITSHSVLDASHGILFIEDISEYHNTYNQFNSSQQTLKKNVDHLQSSLQTRKHIQETILNTLFEGYILFNTQGIVSKINCHASAIFKNYDPLIQDEPKSYAHLLKTMLHASSPVGETQLFDEFQSCLENPSYIGQKSIIVARDQQLYHLDYALISSIADNNSIDGVCFFIANKTKEYEHAATLQLSHDFFQNTIEGILVLNEENKIILVNDIFKKFYNLQYHPNETFNMPLLFPNQDIYLSFLREFSEKQNWNKSFWFSKHNNPDSFPMAINLSVFKYQNRSLDYRVFIVRNYTNQKKIEDDIFFKAHHDSLTGLVNRSFFKSLVSQALEQTHPFKDHVIVLLFIDLDGFKPINDTYGHRLGNILLQMVAQRLKKIFRPQDVIARYGGDEFVIMCHHMKSEIQEDLILKTYKRILKDIEQPFHIPSQNLDLFIRTSIGMSFYPQHETSFEPLLHAADRAMYHVKKKGGGDIMIFQPDLFNNDPLL